MLSKKNIIFHTKILLGLLLFHFVLTTFIRYQLGLDLHISFLNNGIINLWKDIYLVFIYFLILGYTYKYKTYNIIKKYPIYFGSILVLILISLIFTFLNFHGLKSLIIGFKYDIWFLLPAFLFPLIDFTKQDIKDFFHFFIKLIKIAIIFSLIFAFIRLTMPKFLFLLGYGPLGDWKPNTPPPMYFDTGIYGVQRFSGIFSGPNHMAFYFIAFGPLILLAILSKKLKPIWGILYLILLFGTLSRSGILAFLVEIFLLGLYLFFTQKGFRKIILLTASGLTVIFISLIGYLFISGKYHQVILRGASTKGHIIKFTTTLEHIKNKPLIGHGIGTAGPAAHYIKTDIIPESRILQIFYELGIIGGFIWFFTLFLIPYYLWKFNKTYKNTLNYIEILNIGLVIGIIGLFIQGLVLHSFEDSIVSLSLFVLIGILLGYHFNFKK